MEAYVSLNASSVESTKTDDGSAQPRQIELPREDINAIGCFFEFLYTGEYFPKKIPGQRQLERHPSIPGGQPYGRAAPQAC
jgi:hypothetical protein